MPSAITLREHSERLRAGVDRFITKLAERQDGGDLRRYLHRRCRAGGGGRGRLCPGEERRRGGRAGGGRERRFRQLGLYTAFYLPRGTLGGRRPEALPSRGRRWTCPRPSARQRGRAPAAGQRHVPARAPGHLQDRSGDGARPDGGRRPLAGGPVLGGARHHPRRSPGQLPG